MKRRTFLAGTAGLAITSQTPARAQAAPVNVVQRFGFVADGKTDNYAAFRRLADHATRVGGGRYLFPPGVYWVAKYRTTETYQREAFQQARPADVVNAVYKGCRNLELSGKGAVIRLNGRFHRSAKAKSAGLLAGIFMPFELRRCDGVTISGFEIDGGARAMTKDYGVTEAYAALIALNGSRNVTLRDLYLHHSQTDAIYLGDDATLSGGRGVACRNVRIERVRCENNARGALAALQILGLTCTDSQFNGSSFGTGNYGRHAPGFGVDVEPDRYQPAEVDTMTGNLHFERCQFRDNFSAFLAAYPRKYQGYLRLIDCSSSNAGNAPNHMILVWPGAELRGGTHEIGSGTVWTSWDGTPGGNLTIRDATFRGNGNFGIFHAHEDSVVRLERVTLIATHRAPVFGAFPAIEGNPGGGRRNVVQDCRFVYPRARKAAQPAGEPTASFNHVTCSGNRFETDLPATGGQYFQVMYHANAVVLSDRFSGTAPGLRDSIRPNAVHDTRLPFRRG